MNTKRNKLITLAIIFYTITYFIILNLDFENEVEQAQASIERYNYSKIIVQAIPKTIIDKNTPYQLKTKNKIISPVFILSEIKDEYSENKSYYIELPSEEIINLDENELFTLYDIDMVFKKEIKKELKNYEIDY